MLEEVTGKPWGEGVSGSQEGVWDAVQEAEEEKEMATHSSILAWEIPWIEEPGGLYSPWSHKE